MNRAQNFQEAEKAYLPHQALLEASRCLFCHDAPCTKACPAGIDVAGFIRRLKGANAAGAAQLIFEANVLGGTCGRVCPVEILCQEACSHTELSEPIKIGRLQAFAWDQGYAQLDVGPAEQQIPGKVAVIGAGPAGLAAAAELSRLGYRVKLYEADQAAGGVLSAGIPAYRLPQDVLDRELTLIERMGVEFSWGHRAGHDLTLTDMQSAGFGAVFLGIGLGQSARVGLPGEDLEGVFWAADLLREIKSNPRDHSALADRLGQRVAVIGGGNVAVDVACSMLRLGVQKVELVCLEGPREMPAFTSEIHFALDEGVELHTRCQPVRILGDGEDRVVGLEGVGIDWKKPGLFVPDNAVPVPGTEFRLQAESVVEAIGQRPDAAILEAFQLEIASSGLVAIDEESGQTSNPMVFAAGDVANGGATVVQAVAEGKRAARGIHRFLQERT